MTPEEQLELDTLKQKLRTTENLLADSKGRIKAVELDSHEIKRNAKLATDQANALKEETEASLATAAEQMKIAHSVGLGIYGMAELCRAFMARKVAAARVSHREAKSAELLQSFIDAIAKNDQTQLKAVSDRAKQKIAVIKADSEASRNKAAEYALAYGYKNFEKVFDSLMEDNSTNG